MKKLLSFLFSLICFTAFSQYTPLQNDFNRPGAGANEWSYDQNIVNIPVQGTNTQRLDRYWRFTWLDFQPATGSAGAYNFSVFDSKIQQSITRGQTFSFGVMQQCGGCDANLQTNISGAVMLYPTWLHTQMQSESVKDFNSGGEWFPNYNSPSYLIALKNLNIAINNHILTTSFNGTRYQDVIGQIDIRGYGDFGEWTNNVFTNGNLTVASGDSIISYHVHIFDKFQCVYMMATVDGGQLGNTNVPPGVGYYALTVSNSVGKLGWRRDSWGQTDNYLSQWTDTNPTTFNGLSFKTEIMSRYQFAPIVGEPQDGGSAGNFPNLPAQILKYGVTSFGNGNFNSGVNATIQNNFRAASQAAGYRLSLTAGSVNGNAVSLTWLNAGAAPDYKNWNVTLELRNAGVVILSSVSKFNPRLFLPGTKTVIDTLIGVGSGDLYVTIKDPVNYRKPMPLAIAGQLADGSYLIKSGVVLTGTVIVPPPVDTTKSVTNCDTLITKKDTTLKSRTVIDTTYKSRIIVDTTFGSHTDTLHRTCGTPVSVPVSIYTNQVPTSATETDNTPIELGVKFKSSVTGTIKGVSFYKTAGNNGSHIGELYDAAGNRLASASFANETATGWQTVLFSTPVPVTAGVVYTAAYFSPAGTYVSTLNVFASQITNGPLSASSGVYIYANGNPINTYQKSAYWVDVKF